MSLIFSYFPDNSLTGNINSNKSELQSIFKYLEEFHLPQFPTILNITDQENHGDQRNYKFNWIESSAEIKRSTSIGLLFDVGIAAYSKEDYRTKCIYFDSSDPEKDEIDFVARLMKSLVFDQNRTIDKNEVIESINNAASILIGIQVKLNEVINYEIYLFLIVLNC